MDTIAVILAGGKGTRFVPFTTNKTMWSIAGATMLEHTIRMVQAAGLSKIIVVANPHNESLLQTYQSTSPNLQYRLQKQALGMDDALISVADLISNKPILVLNAVDLIEINCIKRMVEHIHIHKPKLMVCGMRVPQYVPSMGYYVIRNNRVFGVMEKPAQGAEPSQIIRMVADYFETPQDLISLFSRFSDPQTSDMHYELAQDILLKAHGADIEFTSYWSKLKHPHYVLQVMHTYLHHRMEPFTHPSAHVAPTAIIEGAVHIDADAHIGAYAVVKGPSYIGRGSVIGDHSLVRHSMIEEKATVGFASEVARSYVGPRSNIHHGFVGDSVLEAAVNMSWGTVTTNLRLDRKNVRCRLPDKTYLDTGMQKLGAMIADSAFLGANVSTMPGTCIEAHSTIPPQSIVK